MKVFCSYAYTGEDKRVVEDRLVTIRAALERKGHEYYIGLFDDVQSRLSAAGDVRGIFEHVYRKISKYDVVLAIVASDRRSEGQLLEIGAAMEAGLPLYLLVQESVGATHLRKIADKTCTWVDSGSLELSINELLATRDVTQVLTKV